MAMGGVDRVENVFDFLVNGLTKFGRGELQPGLNKAGVLLNRKIRILVFVVEYPAFALSNNLVAEFLSRQFVAPLPKCTFGEFLDVSLVDERYTLAAIFECVLNCHPYKAFCARDGDRFDADAGIETNLLLATLQHVFVEELDEFGNLGSAFFPFNSGVDVFGVLTEDHEIHSLGMLYRRRHSRVILHRPNASVQVENLS